MRKMPLRGNHLKVKSEWRWDMVEGRNANNECCEFAGSGAQNFDEDDQMVWLLAAEYVF